MSNPKVFLIDAHGLCYRAFYAVKVLANSKGQATNAVFGFTNIFKKLLRDFNPEYMVACFDIGKKTLRQEKFAEYKAQRQSMPEDLRSQIPIIRDVLKAYHIPLFEQEGYEADDMIATLATYLSAKKVNVVIVSDDKDLSQLMSEYVQIYSPRHERILNAQDIMQKFGVPSNRIVDLLSLAGDASDNIPGVAGIGQVTAVKLLTAYGSLDGVYEHLSEIKPAGVQEKLRVGREQALMSREQATMHNDLPIKADLEDLRIQEPNRNRLYEIFTDLEFKRLAQEFSSGEILLPVDDSPRVTTEAINYLEIEEDGKSLTLVYDLKKLYKDSPGMVQGDVFDVFLAQYLIAGGLNKVESQAPFSEDGFKKLYQDLKKELHEQKLEYLFYQVEMPLSKVLYEMQVKGVQLDLDVLKKLSVTGAQKMSEVQESLFKIAGVEFNINSPKQLSEILFERLKLPVVKKTKTGFSTDEEVLNKLASKHPLPALILEYRQMAKLKSTYIDALPELVDGNNRVHASFNQMGAETGRLSSNNPNLQNIPIRTDLGRQIRRAFVSYGSNHLLLAADYSQIELRLLAHGSQDPNLMKAFKSDGDIHKYTASLMFDVPESQVDEKMRYAAKRINFGIIYGMSAFGLSKDLDVSMREAQDFIDKYFLRYPKVREMMDLSMAQAKEQGYVETMFHRRRYLPDIKSANVGLRQFAQRQAINAPLQGTAADLIKIAMVNIDQAMKAQKLSSTMIMTVHDELVFDVHVNEKDEMAVLVKHHMEKAMDLIVPLKADLKIGSNWMEMEKI